MRNRIIMIRNNYIWGGADPTIYKKLDFSFTITMLKIYIQDHVCKECSNQYNIKHSFKSGYKGPSHIGYTLLISNFKV